ncbi:MAG: RNA polymerase sigma factor FliA [Pseudomonadales bacterium]|nr:RNA polymerase sigma factor FliA [Pseudomonadales bacterium]
MSRAGIGAYAKTNNQLVTEHTPLVKRIAHHLLQRLPSSVQLDDLVQAGMLGLLEASNKYDATKGASFSTFAGIRIRGAMLDEVRRGDWAPRSVYRNSRRISQAIREKEYYKGGEASDIEIAEHLQVSMEEYSAMLRDSVGCRLFSFDEIFDVEDPEQSRLIGSSPSVLEEFQRSEFGTRLVEAVDRLPEREKLVMSLYYTEELNLREIGEILGVSESRVSQIHSQATLRLKSRLADWAGE